MNPVRAWLFGCFTLVSGFASAATEVGVVTMVEGSARVLRAATWYKLVPGARIDDGDIFEAGERSQVNLELTSGNVVNLVGPGQIYLVPPSTRGPDAAAPPTFVLPSGWLKTVAKPPGLRVRTAAVDITASDAITVVRALPLTVELFVESGSVRLSELLPSGTVAAPREAKRGEYWSKTGATAFVAAGRAPRPFIDSLPRHFADALPNLTAKYKTKPVLVADRDISFAEAEPWLAGRDRGVFERRFSGRLRDPVFRKAAEPNASRYPMWDRILHPEKYLPKPAPVK